ncbi:MAG: non-ribosomal peptide synthetase [Steroidobacteraceae bacterium]
MAMSCSTVGQRISEWAVATPDAPAIQSLGDMLSYAVLQRRVARLARWMIGRGVDRGDIVALDMERSAELVIAMLATWRIGAAFLPLDRAWPTMRRDTILADARPALVVSTVFEEHWVDAGHDLPAISSPSDLAYVLYTSGSTGVPKGVMVEQSQLLNYVRAATEALRLEENRRWGLLGSLAADLGYTALFGGLFNGACIVIAAANEVEDGGGFARFVSNYDIDAVKIVPSHLDALLECDGAALPGKVILGGEATPRALLDRIMKIAPGCQVFNHYGPTETTVGVMVHEVDLQAERDMGLPLTRVLSNCTLEVLDDERHAVPAGALGEVHVGGAQVCRGYLHGRNPEAFRFDPDRPGERLYRTGDLAYRLPDGGIRLAGRIDQQVKIRGFRVELAEIEAALLAHGDVRQAAVIFRPGAVTELVAFVVADVSGGAEETRQRLREALSASLPAYMVPSMFCFAERLPRLPNGKIDRVALADIRAQSARSPGSNTTRDCVEFVVMHFMAEVLKREALEPQDDFFDLGGHSLLAIKLVARIQKRLGVAIPPATLFDRSTPAALTAAVRGACADVANLELRADGWCRQLEESHESAQSADLTEIVA